MKDKNIKKEKIEIPNHIAFIIDGNRRWASERNLPSFEGHKNGYEKIKNLSDWAFEKGVKIISVFVFSTENWKRSQEEVNYLMKLLEEGIIEETKKAKENNYQIIVSGRLDELPGDLNERCKNSMLETRDCDNGILNICLNYGGRAEIVDAFKKMVKNKIEIDQIHEGMIKKYLYNSSSITDPDIIVRTSGEQRLSGFLLWQSAYSELIFINKFWPDFEENDLDLVIQEYNNRKRRFGK